MPSILQTNGVLHKSPNEDPNTPSLSQSHFTKFENFTPNDDAPFDNEFSRLASSQNWMPGFQLYTQERTIAMRQELRLHYFTENIIGNGLTEEQKLQGFQSLCREIRLPAGDSIAECKKQLKSTLVNIVDLIDARRTCKEVRVWHDFDEFRNYTLQDQHRINMDEAEKDGGYLASLLQRLRRPSLRRRKRCRTRDTGSKGSLGHRVKKNCKKRG